MDWVGALWFRYLLLIINGPKEFDYFLLRIMWQLLLGLELGLLVLSMSVTRLSTLERKQNPAKKEKS